MLDSLFSSKMRVQILMRLFLNPNSRAYLRELAKECSASPGHLRHELQRLTDAGLLISNREGRKVLYRAHEGHPLFPELQSMVRKSLGMDRILDSIIERLGQLELALLTGDYADGRDTGIIDLVLVGEVARASLEDLVAKTERRIGRKLRTLVLTSAELDGYRSVLERQPSLLLWKNPQKIGDCA